MNKNDLRYIKTEKLIIDTFIDCIEDVGFEGTTVSMICEKALISRNTFYIHYEDKYALLNNIFVSFDKQLSESMDDKILNDIRNSRFEHNIRWMIDFMYKNRRMVRVLINSSRKDFYNLIEHNFISKPLELVDSSYSQRDSTVEMELIKSYMINATIGFISTWVNLFESIPLSKVHTLYGELCPSSSNAYISRFVKK